MLADTRCERAVAEAAVKKLNSTLLILSLALTDDVGAFEIGTQCCRFASIHTLLVLLSCCYF